MGWEEFTKAARSHFETPSKQLQRYKVNDMGVSGHEITAESFETFGADWCKSEDVAELERRLEVSKTLMENLLESARSVVDLAERSGVSDIINRGANDGLVKLERATKAN